MQLPLNAATQFGNSVNMSSAINFPIIAEESIKPAAKELSGLRKPAFTFNAAQEVFRTQCRNFLDAHARPFIDDWEMKKRIPFHSLLAKMHQSGLLGMRYPLSCGGKGLDIAWHAVLAEELGRIPCGGLGMGLTIHHEMVAPLLETCGLHSIGRKVLSDALQGKCLLAHAVSEIGAGSDLGAIQSRLDKTASGFLLNGRKVFVSMGQQADWFCVLAQGPGNGRFPFNMTLVLIPRDAAGIQLMPQLTTLGHRSMDVCDLEFTNVAVQEHYFLGSAGMGYIRQAQQFIEERVIAAFRSTATAAYICDATWAFARERKNFAKPLADQPALQFRLAELRARCISSREANLDALSTLLAGENVEKKSAACKFISCRLAREAANEALQLFAGAAYIKGHEIERLYRDVRLLSLSTGSEEIMLHTLSTLEGMS
jgi:citronellyl-CoA dehydrogenase